MVDCWATFAETEAPWATTTDQPSLRDRRNILSAAHRLPMAAAPERVSSLEHGLLVLQEMAAKRDLDSSAT